MTKVEALGLMAGLLTTLSFLRQVMKMIRTKCAKDLSLGEYLLYSSGVLLWLAYGIALQQLPLILWHGTGLLLACTVIGLKIFYCRNTWAPGAGP
jgi:MtN3 and saliva related transmembrane protein